MIFALALVSLASTLPAPLPATPWVPPVVHSRTLSNGLIVHALPRQPTGTFELRLVVRVGEPADPVGKEGLADVAWDVADEAAGNLDAPAFSRALRSAGALLTTEMQGDASVVRLRGLSRHIDQSVPLWASVVVAPTLTQADLDVVRGKAIERVEIQVLEPNAVADRVQAHVLWGNTSLGRAPTPASLRAIEQADLRAFFDVHVRPVGSFVLVAGDVDLDALVKVLETHFSAWSGERPVPVVQARNAPDVRIVFADVPGAPQAAIRAFGTTIRPDHAELAALDIANAAIGGAFSSRINLNLREDKGWTYGARCRIVHHLGDSVVQCGSLVRANVAGPALAEVKRELEAFVSDAPLTEEESATFRTAVGSAFAVDREASSAMLGEVGHSALHGLPMDQIGRYLAAVRAVDHNAAVRAAKRHLGVEHLTFVVAGDKQTVLPQLETLGLPVVVLP